MGNKLHIDNWISKAEPDYYSMFMKAWIPLNAWYVDKYPDQNANDSKIINLLIADKNEIKAFIHSLLSDTDSDYERFSFHLAQLHIELQKKKFHHKEELVSFTSLRFEKHKTAPVYATDENGINYLASQPDGIQTYFRALIVKEKKTYLSVKMPQYDLAILVTHEDFVGLPNAKMRDIISGCFKRVDPKLAIDATTASILESEYILISNNPSVRFKNDIDLIANGIIKILYALRCMLFHGELNPTENNSVVYEHAYQILRYIIKKLK